MSKKRSWHYICSDQYATCFCEIFRVNAHPQTANAWLLPRGSIHHRTYFENHNNTTLWIPVARGSLRAQIDSNFSSIALVFVHFSEGQTTTCNSEHADNHLCILPYSYPRLNVLSSPPTELPETCNVVFITTSRSPRRLTDISADCPPGVAMIRSVPGPLPACSSRAAVCSRGG